MMMMMMMIQSSFANLDECGHFYVMGCQLMSRRRQLGPIGPLHKLVHICAVILDDASLFFLAFSLFCLSCAVHVVLAQSGGKLRKFTQPIIARPGQARPGQARSWDCDFHATYY
jgi:hypothetical protein